MRCILHITAKPESNAARELIESQKRDPANEVRRFDLTMPEPDYNDLLYKIFDADSIECW